MNVKKIVKTYKLIGPILIFCGLVGFFYVLNGGPDVEPADTLVTITFLFLGFYFTWLGNNPKKIKKFLKKNKKDK